MFFVETDQPKMAIVSSKEGIVVFSDENGKQNKCIVVRYTCINESKMVHRGDKGKLNKGV